MKFTKYFLMLLLILVLMFVASAFVLALPTVDYSATTTTLRAVQSLNLDPFVNWAIGGAILVMQLLKYFFPRIDGKS